MGRPEGRMSMLRRVVAWMVLGLVALLVLFGLTLAIPLETWRTGQQSSKPLPVVAPSELPAAPVRIWVDTDAACGEGPRTDPDDCLAIWHLVRQADLTVAGISTVFFPFSRMPALLIEPLAPGHYGSHPGTLYCHGLSAG